MLASQAPIISHCLRQLEMIVKGPGASSAGPLLTAMFVLRQENKLGGTSPIENKPKIHYSSCLKN
jgi:hypothetical protein